MHGEVSGSGGDREPEPPWAGADARTVHGPNRLLDPEDLPEALAEVARIS